MKLLLICPPFSEHSQKDKGMPIAPPVLEYLAGLTRRLRPDIEIALLDAKHEHFDAGLIDADLVGISVMTAQATWAYRAADALRERGIRVVLGGIHPTAMPEEASAHADALVLGECENVWAEVLRDAEQGRLGPRYQGGLPELNDLAPPVTDRWNQRYMFGYFQTARGCPHRCSFCSVHKFFGNRIRLRPIGEVIREVAANERRLFWCIDDNVWGVNPKRSIELFREMSTTVRGKWWFGSGDLRTVQQPEGDQLLKYARRAGLTAVMLGWETENIASLEEYRAMTKQGSDRRDALRRIRDHGIDVMLFIVVGGRNDTKRDFDDILKLCDDLQVSAHPVMLTPLPDTELFRQYEPYLYPEMDWDLYDGNHAVFDHPTMDPLEREAEFIKLRTAIFTPGRILSRIRKVSWKGFPMSHFSSFMLQYPQGRAFKDYARTWMQKHPEYS
ncbi:MAG: B12-binding domain-containing radical SAM protein [Nitrospirota bacterium]|nr:B12-binding domain-containing radical SAM protein [Nitrospirota bacterium]